MLLQLLTVVVRGRLLDLRLDLLHARFDLRLLAGTVDEEGRCPINEANVP